MNEVYANALDAMLTGALDVHDDGLTARLVDDGYVFDPVHASLADVPVPSRVGDPVELTGVFVDGGAVEVDDVTFPGVAAGRTVTGVVVHTAAGLLVAYVHERADTVPLAIETNGAAITLSWPSSLFTI